MVFFAVVHWQGVGHPLQWRLSARDQDFVRKALVQSKWQSLMNS